MQKIEGKIVRGGNWVWADESRKFYSEKEGNLKTTTATDILKGGLIKYGGEKSVQ